MSRVSIMCLPEENESRVGRLCLISLRAHVRAVKIDDGRPAYHDRANRQPRCLST